VIDLPDPPTGSLTSHIKEQHAYFDFKSYEEYIKKVRRKYKLTAKTIKLEQNFYPFFILTTRSQACQEALTVCIERDHWEQRKPGHLERTSYLDIKKIETLTEEEIILKIKDSKNGFPLVAKLCDKKYQEIKDKRHSLHLARTRIPASKCEIINYVLAEVKEEVADKILRNLDLK